LKPLNVLLVTYSFPPVGGVGVLRAASLARYLPTEGIRLDVLTTRNASAVGTDSKLLKDIPGEVTIHRTLTLDLPFGIKKWIKTLISGRASRTVKTAATTIGSGPGLLKRSIQDILLPDPQITWLPILSRAAKRIIKSRGIELVLITVPPFSSVLLVSKLRKEFPHLAIVVDFRDEWLSTTIDLVSFSRSERALNVSRQTEADAVSNATAIVAVTEAARREIRSRYPDEPDNKFHFVPNGFDGRMVNAPSPSRESRSQIVATYIGTVYRSTEPTTLVKAMLTLPPELRSRIKLRFIGRIEEPRYREALLELGDMVGLIGFVPQHEALAAMNQADYALLITHDPLNVSAKFYDYVGAGKPILAIVHPDGEVRRLMEELNAGWWADSRDVEAIRSLFLDAVTRGNSLPEVFHPNTEQIAQYERKILAQRYAALLHSIGESPQGASQMPADSSQEAR
jgi:hypothetical protein